MNKCTLYLAFLCFLFGLVTVPLHSQFNSQAPWMQELEARQSPAAKVQKAARGYSLPEIQKAFYAYWKDKDSLRKGSGYKPFKRWEYYWSHFTDTEGYLPTPKALEASWKQKQKQALIKGIQGQWESIGPYTSDVHPIESKANPYPGVGRLNAIAVDPQDPDLWYVGAPTGGLWKSSDAGTSWVHIDTGLLQVGVSAILIDPADSNTIYIATGDDDAGDSYTIGVYKSTDGGQSWTATGLNLETMPEGFHNISELKLDTGQNRLWAATSFGLYLSTDAGNTWEKRLDEEIKALELNPADANTLYAASPNTFYKSSDGGAQFRAIRTGLPAAEQAERIAMAVSPADPNYVYLVVAGEEAKGSPFRGVFRSTDRGETFRQTLSRANLFDTSLQAWFDLAIAVSPQNVQEVYVGCLNIWKSSDGGDYFKKLNDYIYKNATYTHADIHTLAYIDDRLFVCSDGGIYSSNNQGASFTDHNTAQMNITQFYRMGMANNSLETIVAGSQDNSGFIRKDNIWGVFTHSDGMDYEVDPSDPNRFYGLNKFGATLFYFDQKKEQVSSDRFQSVSGKWVTPLAVDRNGGVYIGHTKVSGGKPSPKGGLPINVISSQLINGEPLDDLECAPTEAEIIYASEGRELFRSENAAVSFVKIASFESKISDMQVDQHDPNRLYVVTSARSLLGQYNISTLSGEANDFEDEDHLKSGVYEVQITDGDTIETQVTSITYDLPTEQTFFSIAHQGLHQDNPLFVGTNFGVYRFDRSNRRWEDYSQGLPSLAVSDLEINHKDGVLVASTYGRGIWKTSIPLDQADDDGDGIPDVEDNCPKTPNSDQADFDGDGVGDVCDRDIDNDKFPNFSDACHDTRPEDTLGVDGCTIFSLAFENFEVQAQNTSCEETQNGNILVSAQQPLNYTVDLRDEAGELLQESPIFRASHRFTDLAQGRYTICIGVEGQSEFQRCYDLEISGPDRLLVRSAVDKQQRSMELHLSGGETYKIHVNKTVYTTRERLFRVPLRR